MKRILIVCSFIVLMLFGCTTESQQYADVRVLVDNGSVMRTIMPEEETVKVKSYKIFYQMEGSEEVLSKPFTGKSITLEKLKVGKWNMHVEGYNATGESIATSAEKVVAVIDSGAKPVEFKLKYNSAQNGTFKLAVSVPSSADDASAVKVVLDPTDTLKDQKTLNLTESKVVGKKKVFSIEAPLAVAHYDITIEVVKAGGIRYGVPYMESLHIYENMVSCLEIDWADGMFKKAAAPQFSSLPSAQHNDGDRLELIAEDGATIYYTLDDTKPDSNSIKYTSAINLDKNMVVRAYAVKPGLVRSEYVRGEFNVKVNAPVFNYDSNTYDAPIQVSLTTSSSHAKIYYTLDGTTPSATHGQLYSNAFTIETPTVVKAIAVKDGLQNSDVIERDYKFSSQDGNITVEGPEFYTLSLVCPAGYEPNHNLTIGNTWSFQANITPVSPDVTCEYKWYLDAECLPAETSSSIKLNQYVSREGIYRLTLKVKIGDICLTENRDIYAVR